jgi:hypothetical protein
MKINTVISILAITLVTSFSHNLSAAEEQSPEMKLIKMMDFSKTAKAGATATFAPFLKQLQEQGLPEAAIKEVNAAAERFFTKSFDNPEIEVEIAKIYAEIYTKEEIAELIKFYETPVGKKSLETMPKVMIASSEIGQKFAMQNQAGFQAEMQEIMAKHMPAKAE